VHTHRPAEPKKEAAKTNTSDVKAQETPEKRPEWWGPPKPPMFPETILPSGRKAISSEYGATGFEIFTEAEKAERTKQETENKNREGEKQQ
jgi:hypothetical protein